MDRRTFIKSGCMACAGMSVAALLMESCSPVKYATARINENGLTVPLSEFRTAKGYSSYVIVRHGNLQYPICLYRLDDQTYSALWMRCTHQGAELQVAGDQLTCPAHGSEFDKWGKVTQQPAAMNLRSFPVKVENDNLLIDLSRQTS